MILSRILILSTVICMAVFLLACLFSGKESTEAIPAVNSVNLEKYAGKWYEIARMDHSFEKGLVNVTATYSLQPGGKVRVLNEGYKNTPSGKKSTAEGKARVPDPSQPGRLKVSFFLFFGAEYKIIALDEENYSYALVTSGTKDYVWILSRTPQMESALYDSLLSRLRDWGFKTGLLLKVPQQWNP